MSLTWGFVRNGMLDSQDFSNAVKAVIGDGVADAEGSRFSITVNGFTVTISSGYAFSDGRFVKNDEPVSLSIQSSLSTRDRIDAVVVRVDYAARKAYLEILTDIAENGVLPSPSSTRNNSEYSIILYFIRVRRGATSISIEDITDVREDNDWCGKVIPLSGIAENVLYVYNFLTTGLDQEKARLIRLSNQVIQKADTAVGKFETDIQNSGAVPEIGEVMVSPVHPLQLKEWLLCDGGPVPAEYPALTELLDGILPDIPDISAGFHAYIYGGEPIKQDSTRT